MYMCLYMSCIYGQVCSQADTYVMYVLMCICMHVGSVCLFVLFVCYCWLFSWLVGWFACLPPPWLPGWLPAYLPAWLFVRLSVCVHKVSLSIFLFVPTIL